MSTSPLGRRLTTSTHLKQQHGPTRRPLSANLPPCSPLAVRPTASPLSPVTGRTFAQAPSNAGIRGTGEAKLSPLFLCPVAYQTQTWSLGFQTGPSARSRRHARERTWIITAELRVSMSQFRKGGNPSPSAGLYQRLPTFASAVASMSSLSTDLVFGNYATLRLGQSD